MEGSNYEDKCSQQANDMGRMSNCEKRNDKSKKRKSRVNCNRGQYSHNGYKANHQQHRGTYMGMQQSMQCDNMHHV